MGASGREGIGEAFRNEGYLLGVLIIKEAYYLGMI